MPNISDSFNFPGNFIDARSKVPTKQILDAADKSLYPIGFEVFVVSESQYYTLITHEGSRKWVPRQNNTEIGSWT